MTKTSQSPDPLDLTGLLCPLVVRRARGALASLRDGEELLFVGDDPAMRIDVPAWCADEGHELVSIEESGGSIRCRVRRRRPRCS